MNRPANVKFLTDRENQCLELLLQAQEIFDEICMESPQSSADTYNFGHYVEAARTAILLRGARRIDHDNLLKKHSAGPALTPVMLEHARSTSKDYGVEGKDWSEHNGATS